MGLTQKQESKKRSWTSGREPVGTIHEEFDSLGIEIYCVGISLNYCFFLMK